MRILLLTQWFDPEPTFKGLLFARELAARGHDIQVLTGFPNYPGGEIYPGYKIRPWRREKIDGISILRVALYPSHDKSAFGRVLNYASFAISAAFIGTALIAKPDIIYVYHPPATIAFAAVVIGFLRRVPFVYDIMDLWPDSVGVSGMLSSPAAIALLGKWCNFVYHRASHIVAVSQGFKARLIGRGVSRDKIDVIYNWCDEAAMAPGKADPELASELGLAGRFNVIFAGTMGTGQALDSVIEAAALCRQTLPEVQFVFVGGGVERGRLEKKAADLGLTNVRFLPRRPTSTMGAVLALADVLLVHLKSDPLFDITIPGKTQACMAARKPVLMAVRGDAAQLITQSGGGLVCESENPASIAATVARFAAMSPEERRGMGEAGRRFYDEHLSLKAGVTRFEAIFAGICRAPVSASFYRRFGKRLFDLLLSIPVLILCSPFLLLIAFCSRLLLGKPVLFRQRRAGYHGAPFTLRKFRSMLNTRDEQGELLPDARRLTAWGRFLRGTSLDELPELWNVIKGEMSLIGPRPLPVDYTPLYTVDQARRLDAVPGVAGYAALNGRNAQSWESIFERDVWYVDHVSFRLDLQIIHGVIGLVLSRSGIDRGDHDRNSQFQQRIESALRGRTHASGT